MLQSKQIQRLAGCWCIPPPSSPWRSTNHGIWIYQARILWYFRPSDFLYKNPRSLFFKYYYRLSPGTDVEVNVVPQVTLTTEDAINKFSPTDRGCYACDEAKFRFMPSDPGKCLSQFIFDKSSQPEKSIKNISDPEACEQRWYRYSFSNCQFESVMENILEECGCYLVNCPTRWSLLLMLLIIYISHPR